MTKQYEVDYMVLDGTLMSVKCGSDDLAKIFGMVANAVANAPDSPKRAVFMSFAEVDDDGATFIDKAAKDALNGLAQL